MKFNATLCTTNGDQPWAANIDFQFLDNKLVAELNMHYAHYKNLETNKNAVVVYKNENREIIIKASLVSTKQRGETATIALEPTWLRLVEDDTMNDISDSKDISSIIREKITGS